MKSKSKRNMFVVVLQTLLMLMSVSAFAKAEGNEDIGVPQAMEAPAKGCFGTTLSPDENHFHSVREGLLTHYQIAPFTKISSVAIEWEPIKAMRNSHCGILMSHDYSKLIIYFPKKIFVLDGRTGHLLKWLERPQNVSIASAVVNGNEIVLLETGPDYWENRDWYKLTILDLDALKLKTEIRHLGERVGFFVDPNSNPGMLKTLDRIYLMDGSTAAVLNSKTYAPELSISFSKGVPMISRDFKKIYAEHVSGVTDYLTKKQATYDEVKDELVLAFNQETRESVFVPKTAVSKKEYHSGVAMGRFGSRNRNYVMIGPRGIGNITTGDVIRFHQYESGEAILLGRDNKKFQLTPAARQYLMMKNREGYVIPINDATFAKYHDVAASNTK